MMPLLAAILFRSKGRRGWVGFLGSLAVLLVSFLVIRDVLAASDSSFETALWINAFCAAPLFTLIIFLLPDLRCCSNCGARSPLHASFCYRCNFALSVLPTPPALVLPEKANPLARWWYGILPAFSFRKVGRWGLRVMFTMVIALLVLGGGVAADVLKQAWEASVRIVSQDSPPPIVPTSTPSSYVEVVIALQDLPRGMRIPPNVLSTRRIPEVTVPFDSITSVDRVVGKYVSTDIMREQTILSSMIQPTVLFLPGLEGSIVIFGGGNAIVPSGGFLNVNAYETVEGILQPGDWMDTWSFYGNVASPYSLTLIYTADDTPDLYIWEISSERWIDGERQRQPSVSTLTVNLPAEGFYEVMVVGGAWDASTAAGRYRLCLVAGSVSPQLFDDNTGEATPVLGAFGFACT
jgi:hypothetical protein